LIELTRLESNFWGIGSFEGNADEGKVGYGRARTGTLTEYPLDSVCFFVFKEVAKANLEKRMNLRGKTREQLEGALQHKSRSELLDLIHSLVSVEQLLKPAEIASRSCLNKRAVLRDIREGKFGDYYCRAENSIAIPVSGVNEWRRNFRVPANANQEVAK
jgi:hypothetical protein